MQCIYDLHKEQEQGTEVVYFGKKKCKTISGASEVIQAAKLWNGTP